MCLRYSNWRRTALLTSSVNDELILTRMVNEREAHSAEGIVLTKTRERDMSTTLLHMLAGPRVAVSLDSGW